MQRRRTQLQERTEARERAPVCASSTLLQAPEQDRGACSLLLPPSSSFILVFILAPPQAAAAFCSAHQDRLFSPGICLYCAHSHSVPSRMPCTHPTPSMRLYPCAHCAPASLETTGV